MAIASHRLCDTCASLRATSRVWLQVVAGVLNKYTNIAKGWRDRLFVLSGDQLHYYKVCAWA